ncbi:hypothetical protein SPRG_16121 [Saprolegnia parasitica CBS 223.65]|uniref:Uncharacterized protein n=1 Tax=Saprolegnia parasitica (strain CBS 223.65) TaxID=695850 RepID=A0A067BW39_SAPPC|nr:hypothetical protein SPRG_16121 [Saprolegnia parasitica CBS 223.65]KDO18516.1 hypothetical protein SPRG_16121 [Saprolegnia parasitica CBS 223.65]|eukprot:XP_012210776.1 hypothetical protein SPRG_16121 [Saprolegnia parasitica CBS 223.65]
MWVQIAIACMVAASYLGMGIVLHRAHQYDRQGDVATLTFTSRVRYYLQLAFRLLVVTLFCIILVIDVQEYGTTAFSYYTIWNFALQTVYHALAAGFLLSHWNARGGATVVVQSHPLNSLFDICLTNSLLVAVVFWTELYYPTMPWYSYIQHGVNTLLFVLELFLGDFDVQSEDFKYAGMSPTIYTTFIWISHDTWLDGWWPYDFLSMDTSTTPLWYIGIFLGHFVLFGGAYGLSQVKTRCIPTLQPEMTSIQGNGARPTSYQSIV